MASAKTIHIVKDDSILGAIIRAFFQIEGGKVSANTSLEEGLQLARSTAPLAILLDIHQPSANWQAWQDVLHMQRLTRSGTTISAACDSIATQEDSRLVLRSTL